MDFPLKIDKLIEHLKTLSPKQQAATVDHSAIFVSSLMLIYITLDGSYINELKNQLGLLFAPYTAFGLTIAVILGALYCCFKIVNKYPEKSKN